MTCDILLVTAEYFEDHPFSAAGVLNRVLEWGGYTVGLLEKPVTDADFQRLGAPRLCVCITAGAVDSMLNNYTALKRPRDQDQYSAVTAMPDRAVIVYANRIRQFYKGVPIVIGGVEASLRRFAHYDYWDNKVRRSILLDSRADILVYGNGERQLLDIAHRLAHQQDLVGIPGTAIVYNQLLPGFTVLPSVADVQSDKTAFCAMTNAFSNYHNLAQAHEHRFVLQFAYPNYTAEDLDWVYGLPYTRKLRSDSLLELARFSVQTHRGCFGRCSFCAIALHQGDRIISRSESSILAEIESLTRHPDFKGYIDDLTGPAANMYGMHCDTPPDQACFRNCFACKKMGRDHLPLIQLMRKARAIPGVKKVFVRSGVRFDLAMTSIDYIKELSRHHISGCLKIAPEHFSPRVLKLMNKHSRQFDAFHALYRTLNRETRQSLRYYLMVGHPGESVEQTREMLKSIRKYGLSNFEQSQLFTPTPMSVSTCMYYTGLNPRTGDQVHVISDFQRKKELLKLLREGHSR